MAMTEPHPGSAPAPNEASEQPVHRVFDPEDKLSRQDWIELAKIAQANFFNRREVEWKLAFSLWTGIGAFTAIFVLKESVRFPPDSAIFGWPLWGLYAAIWAIYCLVQSAVAQAHATDKSYLIYFTNRAGARTHTNDPKDAGIRDIHWRWLSFHAATTATFLILAWLVIQEASRASAAKSVADEASKPQKNAAAEHVEPQQNRPASEKVIPP